MQQDTAYSAVVVNDHIMTLYPRPCLYHFSCFYDPFGSKRYRDGDTYVTVYAEIGHLKFSPIFTDFAADVPDAHFEESPVRAPSYSHFYLQLSVGLCTYQCTAPGPPLVGGGD